MPYVLGIDVGTNHTTAAISRLDDPAADAVEIVRLSRSRALPSVLHLAEDGSIEVGDDAEKWAASRPERIARGAFLLLTRTESMDSLGGARFTDLLLGQVKGSLGQPMPELDLEDPQARVALYRLRQACAQAKEVFSTAPEALVQVNLPGVA